MDTQQNNVPELNPNHIAAETPEPAAEKLDSLDIDIPIEVGVEKITLISDPPLVEGKCVEDEDESESESESSESEASSSSSSSSSSASSSGSSNSDSDCDGDDEEAGPAVDLEVEEGEVSDSDEEKMVSWCAVDDDIDDGETVGEPIRSKNEIQNLPPVPPVDVTLEPHHQMLPVGAVMSVVGAQVIVEGVEKHDPLNEGSIIWLTESRKPLGLVDEIFGPVKNPYYIVRYNSENEVPAGIQGGTSVSFVPEFANHVLNNKDLYKKGYDASGANDEELSDEYEFSDDEKEAEFRKMQKMSKRGVNEQNPSARKFNKKKVSQTEHAIPTIRDAPAAPLVGQINCSPFSGTGQGVLGGTTTVHPFPPFNADPNFATNGVWTNGPTFPQQPQPSLFPNGLPTNSLSYPHNTQMSHQFPMPGHPQNTQMSHQFPMLGHPQNTQMSHQFPMPGHPFQQQLHPSYGSPFPTMPPGVHSNIFAQPTYAPGFVGQNQMPFGLSSPFPQIPQPPNFSAQQGFPPSELQSERNINLHSSSIPGTPSQFHTGSQPPIFSAQQGFPPTELQPERNINLHSSSNSGNPSEFHTGSSSSRGRKTFHRGGGRGWRPAK